MTNTIALWLGGLILAGLAADWLLYDWSNMLFLGRKLLELTEWVAFWR